MKWNSPTVSASRQGFVKQPAYKMINEKPVAPGYITGKLCQASQRGEKYDVNSGALNSWVKTSSLLW